MTGSDLWAALNAAPPTPYRTEVYEDGPYAWWPLDDQPGNAGVLPVTMLNAAEGNTNVLNVIASPNGLGPAVAFATDGFNETNPGYAYGAQVGLATYTTAADSGWMFGDPQGSPSSFATGNPVTSQPGISRLAASRRRGRYRRRRMVPVLQRHRVPAAVRGDHRRRLVQVPVLRVNHDPRHQQHRPRDRPAAVQSAVPHHPHHRQPPRRHPPAGHLRPPVADHLQRLHANQPQHLLGV